MTSLANEAGPLYQQVVDDILAQVVGGIWPPGSRLPSERALCERYDVSQITVRRALRELAHVGQVYSHHGLGWFVSEVVTAPESSSDIVLVAPNLDWACAAFVQHLINQVDHLGVSVQLALTDGNPQREIMICERATESGARALLVVVHGEEQHLPDRYQLLAEQLDSPVILLWHDVEQLALPKVILDEGLCMQRMTRHVLDLGHRRIAYVGDAPDRVEGQKRYWGFATTLWQHGLDLPLDWVFSGPLAGSSERARFDQVFHVRSRPTALVCSSDERAVEALTILHHMEIRCPQDVAVVGFGDREFAPLIQTPLTTFRFDLEGLASAAAQMLEDVLSGAAGGEKRLTGDVIARASCGKSYPRAL